MINQSIFYRQWANQDLSAFYANYMALPQKMVQHSLYQNSVNFNSLISYAVSMDFKNFQTSFQLQQMRKQLFDAQVTSNQVSQNVCCEVTEKKEEKIKKNLNSKTEQIEKLSAIEFLDLSEKSQKEELKSKAPTLDESSQKILFDDSSIRENKNSDKKPKKSIKSEKIRQLPVVDLVEFAFIRKEALDRVEIEKRRISLLERQVENWNEVQKTRRNEKLQLRRIKY